MISFLCPYLLSVHVLLIHEVTSYELFFKGDMVEAEMSGAYF